MYSNTVEAQINNMINVEARVLKTGVTYTRSFSVAGKKFDVGFTIPMLVEFEKSYIECRIDNSGMREAVLKAYNEAHAYAEELAKSMF